MPELPEVETVRRGLQPYMEEATIDKVELRRADLRFPFPEKLAQRLEGQKIISLGRRAKYLLIELASGVSIISHLGMSGSYRIEALSAPLISNQSAVAVPEQKIETETVSAKKTVHDHMILHLSKGEGGSRIIYNDPRRFGFVLLAEAGELSSHRSLQGLGIEPTGNTLSGAVLLALFASKKTVLKLALLDQSLIAGLGNIYVCEALWRAGLSPLRSAATLQDMPEVAELLALSIREVIAQAIAAGGSSLRDHRQADGALGYFQHSFSVYDREGKPCERCGTPISRIVQGGRSTFYCEQCQI